MSGVADKSGRELYEFGPFRVDAEKELLLRAGQPVALTPKSFQILLTLVRRSGQLVTKDEIMKAVWPDTFVEETNLTRNPQHLQSEEGIGRVTRKPIHHYRFGMGLPARRKGANRSST